MRSADVRMVERMRIGVDGQALVGRIPTGFGIYARLLERALDELQAEGALSYHIFKPRSEDKPLRTVKDRLIWERWRLPARIQAETRARGLDIFHSPCLGAPFPARVPIVVTIHDLIQIRHPPRGVAARYYFCGIVPAGWKRASLILCDSDTVKKEVLEYLRIPQDRVQVIYLYSRFEQKKTIGDWKDRGGLDLEVGAEIMKTTEDAREDANWARTKDAVFNLLLVGSIEPRKNFQLALEALSKLPKTIRDKCAISIAGLAKKGAEELSSQAQRLGLEGKINFLGYLSEQKLLETYKQAFLLIAPSKDEGFNLPPLEAMSLGVPVLLSDIPVHREVYSLKEDAPGKRQDLTKDSAESKEHPGFFSPDLAEELAELIARAIEDESFREKLKEFGRRISSTLTAERFKRELLSAYEAVARD